MTTFITVSPKRGGWVIECDGQKSAPLADKAHAISAAVKAAQGMGAQGFKTEVHVYDENYTNLQVEYVHGERYPRRK